LNKSTAELNLPVLKPVGSPAKASAAEQTRSTRVEAVRDASTPPAPTEAANAEGQNSREPAQSAEPSIHVDVLPLRSDPSSAAAPGTSFPEQVDEIPVGLIEDDLLGADLCNDVMNSLRRVYMHHKVIP